MDTGGITDRHGRIVYIPYPDARSHDSASNGTKEASGRLWRPITLTRNIEFEMVRNGWAWVLNRYEPDACYREALEDAAAIAAASGLATTMSIHGNSEAPVPRTKARTQSPKAAEPVCRKFESARFS